MHICEDDVAGGIQCDLSLDARPVLGPTATWQILSSLEAHMESPLGPAVDPTPLQHVSQRYTPPHRSGNRTRTPIKPDALFHHVLFLPSVSRAHQRHGELPAWELVDELLHGKPGGSFHEPANLDGPVFPARVGDGAVVADVMDWDRGDEAVVHETVQGWLRVEGVFSGETDEGGVAFDPAVGGSGVARVEDGGPDFVVALVNQVVPLVALVFVFAGGVRVHLEGLGSLGIGGEVAAEVRGDVEGASDAV